MTRALVPQMRETYQATPAAVGTARNGVLQFALAMGADPSTIKSIAVAVGEACTNVVVHAYRHSTPGEMVVSASVLDGDLTVQVVDHGVGMSPRPDSPGIGMGLPLMSKLSDRLEIRTAEGGGAEVCIRFRLRAENNLAHLPAGSIDELLDERGAGRAAGPRFEHRPGSPLAARG